MTNEQRILVETELCNALKAFHDAGDKQKRTAYSKEYFWSFCERYELDPKEAFDIVKEVLKEQAFVHDYADFTDIIKSLEIDVHQKEPDEERE